MKDSLKSLGDDSITFPGLVAVKDSKMESLLIFKAKLVITESNYRSLLEDM